MSSNSNRGQSNRGKPKGGNRNKDPKRSEGKGTQNKPSKPSTNTRGNSNRGKSTRGGKSNRGGSGKKYYQGNNKNQKRNTKPIERQMVSIKDPLTGQTKEFEKLCKRHALNNEFITFLPCDNDISNPDTLQALKLLNQDAELILKTEFNVFWSTVCYNQTFSEFLNSFLQFWKNHNILGVLNAEDKLYLNVPKSYQLRPEEQERRNLFRNMWDIITRLTDLEEGDDWMSEEHYATFISKRNILTISSLIDISTHYSTYQMKGVSKILSFLFEVQPNYYQELNHVLNQIQDTLSQYMRNIASFSVPKDIEGDKESKLSILDTILFLFSISTSITEFCNVAPPEVSLIICDEHSYLVDQLVILFELIVPQLKQLLEIYKFDETDDVHQKVDITRNSLYSLASGLLQSCYIHPLTKNLRFEKYDQITHALDYLTLLPHIETLSKDYSKNTNLSVPEMKDSFLSFYIDDTLIQSVGSFKSYFQSIDGNAIDQAIEFMRKYAPENSSKGPSTFKVEKIEGDTANTFIEEENIQQPTSQYSSTRLDNIASVKGILDYLGEGFINECLELYNDKVEVVLDRILNESLAEPLLELDRLMPLPAQSSNSFEVKSTTPTKTSIPALSDEFSSFHIGKMKKLYEDEDDDFKEFNKKFYKNIYNDEYDDSMDEYVQFGVDDETADEQVSLTISGEFAPPDVEEETQAYVKPVSKKNQRKNRKKVQITSAPPKKE